jgi:polyisoprenoid-binding protein YceI
MTATHRSVTPNRAKQPRTAVRRWSVVATDSEAYFHVRDKLVTTVHGSLPIEAGGVTLTDGGDTTEAWISLAVPGIATGNGHRDRDLQKPRFLDAARFPSVTVEVETSTSTSTSTECTARAVLRARGQCAPLDLTVQTVTATAETSNPDVTIRVTDLLDRTPLGINVPTFIIGRFLDLEANLTLRRQPEDATPAGIEGRP